MKNFLFFAIPVLALTACSGGDSAEHIDLTKASFRGQLKNSNGDTLYLVNISGGNGKPESIDTAYTDAQGNFGFMKPLPAAGFYNLEVGTKTFVTLILDPNRKEMLKADVTNMAYTWDVESSDENKYFKEFNDFATNFHKTKAGMVTTLQMMQKDYEMQVNLLRDKSKVDSLEKKISHSYDSIQMSAMKLDEDARNFITTFVLKHPASLANIPALYLPAEPQTRDLLLDPYNSIDIFDTTLKSLQAKYPDAPNVKLLAMQVQQIRPLANGAVAPDIALADPNGKMVALSSLRGKVVLLDFWASWCAPCRAELPNVVEAYKKYHGKGFEVFSVSLDADKNQWIQAIKNDKLSWPYHVSDLRQWQSSVVPVYGIQGIPLTFLLDKEGKIIARGLRGIALQDKLAEIFETK
ncbi:MAG: peroxiredoxin [Bacteroidetes bacterium]|nr:MAG: peroxiredoxin [Bacteroidota bacterium]